MILWGEEEDGKTWVWGEKGGGNSLVIKNKQNRVGGFGF